MKQNSTRGNIVEAADRLFYEKGFEKTSFADIADTVNISRGNFYHHFKSKDEILHAVIDSRLAKTGDLLNRWEQENANPDDRIRCFINILIMNRVKIKKYGCPVGTLCAELAKLSHEAQPQANKLFTLFRNWLKRQFILLGRKKDADQLALHLLARSQGVASLANAFKDEKFIRQEVEIMHNWLNTYLS